MGTTVTHPRTETTEATRSGALTRGTLAASRPTTARKARTLRCFLTTGSRIAAKMASSRPVMCGRICQADARAWTCPLHHRIRLHRGRVGRLHRTPCRRCRLARHPRHCHLCLDTFSQHHLHPHPGGSRLRHRPMAGSISSTSPGCPPTRRTYRPHRLYRQAGLRFPPRPLSTSLSSITRFLRMEETSPRTCATPRIWPKNSLGGWRPPLSSVSSYLQSVLACGAGCGPTIHELHCDAACASCPLSSDVACASRPLASDAEVCWSAGIAHAAATHMVEHNDCRAQTRRSVLVVCSHAVA